MTDHARGSRVPPVDPPGCGPCSCGANRTPGQPHVPGCINPSAPRGSENQDMPDRLRPKDHEERIRVARRLAGWELGSRSWADRMIAAYLDPQPTAEHLDREMDRA